MNIKDKIIRPTTQMLLKRMEDKPEDFFSTETLRLPVTTGESWSGIALRGSFNIAEHLLIKHKLTQIRRKETEQLILNLLLDGQARQESVGIESVAHSTVGRFSKTPLKPPKPDLQRKMAKEYGASS